MGDYIRASRQPRYSLTFALPLLLLYEGFATVLSQSQAASVRNGADVLLKTAFAALGGHRGIVVFGVGLIAVGAWLIWRDMMQHPGRFHTSYLAVMLGESLVYAAILGTVVSTLTAVLLSGSLAVPAQAGTFGQLSFPSQVVVSLGAGLYEELLFRVLMVSAFIALGRWLKWRWMVTVTVALIGSALIFSGFHYIGPYGDPWTLPSFTFRAVAGLVLSGLYVARGFGIVAWSHALYDVGIALLQ